MHPSEADKLERFIAERGRPLLAAAKLLTGSQEAAEDLLQAALERLIRHWSRIEGDPEGYLRRTLYNLAADGWRRRRTRIAGLRRLGAAARSGSVADQTEIVDLRDALIRQLLTLPPRQRAVLVLRYWEGLTETEAAALLGCSPGTIKSATSRGLARLRQQTEAPLKESR
jgi:RNA polymerase sigma-70 factor (sigma-E family)